MRLLLAALILLGITNMPADAAVEINTAAPDFEGVDTNGNNIKLSENPGNIVVLEWKNHLCPFVKKHYDSGNMQKLQKELTDKGVIWWSIVSSAPGKQGHVTAEEAHSIVEQEKSHASAVILDPEGTIGKLYDAKTTPHMFVIDGNGKLAYMGAIDSDPSAHASDDDDIVNYVSAAVDSLIAGGAVETPSTAPYGCSVKY